MLEIRLNNCLTIIRRRWTEPGEQLYFQLHLFFPTKKKNIKKSRGGLFEN